jgi:hypothetical protein
MSLEVTKQELLKQAIYLNKLYATTRNQEYKDQEIRVRKIVGDIDTFVSGGGGTPGVTSFNTRTGDVTLLYADIIAALGYIPVDSASSGTNSNVLIDGGGFTSPSENVIIDAGTFI